MFGKKAKKIKELESKLAHRDYADLERYGPLAADIIRRVDAEAANRDAFTNIDLDAILLATEQQFRADRLLTMFRELPPELRLQLLLDAETDSEKAQMIESALYEELQAIDARNNLESVIEKAKRERRIDLSAIPKDTNVKIFLYDKGDFEENPSPKKLKRDYFSDVQIMAISQGDGIYRMVSMKYDASEYVFFGDIDKPHDAKLGTTILVEGQKKLDPMIYYGAALSCNLGAMPAYEIRPTNVKGQQRYIDMCIGRVAINKEELFIN